MSNWYFLACLLASGANAERDLTPSGSGKRAFIITLYIRSYSEMMKKSERKSSTFAVPENNVEMYVDQRDVRYESKTLLTNHGI